MTVSRPRPAGCIFCGSRGLTDEDAIPKWIGRMFSAEGTRRAKTASGQWLTRQNIGTKLVVRRVVCGACNSGWMSKLQTHAKPLLEKMIVGSRIGIGPHEQRVIAAWATMTAMVVDFSELVMPGPIYSQRERTDFYRHHHIPVVTNVWLAHRQSLPEVAVVGWKIDGCTISNHPIEPGTPESRNNVYAITGIFGHLIVQLLSQRPDAGLPDLSRLSVIHDAWGAKHVHLRLLPPELAVTWPPPLPLMEAEVDAFAERWARL